MFDHNPSKPPLFARDHLLIPSERPLHSADRGAFIGIGAGARSMKKNKMRHFIDFAIQCLLKSRCPD